MGWLSVTVAHARQSVEIKQKNGIGICWPYRTFGESGMRMSMDESVQMISNPDDVKIETTRETTRETTTVMYKTITHKTAIQEIIIRWDSPGLWKMYKIMYYKEGLLRTQEFKTGTRRFGCKIKELVVLNEDLLYRAKD